MASKNLRTPYAFATDGNYAAGAAVWSGLPRIVVPSAGALTSGYTPDTALPAETENWLEQVKADSMAVQAHQALRFRRTDLGVGTSSLTKLTAVQQIGGVGSPANRQMMILASGVTTGTFPALEPMLDGTSPGHLYNYGSGGSPLSAPAADPGGVLFWGDSSGAVKQSSNGGASTTGVTVTGLATNAVWVGFTASHYLAFELVTNKLYKATALGGAWTSTTSAPAAISEMIDNGAGTYVILGLTGGNAVAYFSTDDGVTWTAAGTSLAAATSVGGCYSAVDGLFYALTSAGKLYSSINGNTWTLARTIAALSGVAFGQHTVAACGPAIACVVNRGVSTTNQNPYGIAYTFDSGANWFETYIGSPFGPNPIGQLISANGRFYAVDGASLYHSDLLQTPPATLFTGV